MPATALYDLTLLIDMLHQTLDQLEDGVFDLAGLLPLVGSIGRWSEPGDRRQSLYDTFCNEEGKVKSAKANCQDKQDRVQYFTDPLKLSEHSSASADASVRQRRQRGLPQPRAHDHELNDSPAPQSLEPGQPGGLKPTGQCP